MNNLQALSKIYPLLQEAATEYSWWRDSCETDSLKLKAAQRTVAQIIAIIAETEDFNRQISGLVAQSFSHLKKGDDFDAYQSLKNAEELVHESIVNEMTK